MRIALLITSAALVTQACFTNNPASIEYYTLAVDGGASSNLLVSSRPNMNNTVKRIFGHSESGQTFFVDLCLGVTSGNAINPVVREDVMVCYGPADTLGNPTGEALSCFDGRASTDSPLVNVDLVDVGGSLEALNGTVTVETPSVTNPGQNVELVTDFQVVVDRVEAAPTPIFTSGGGNGGGFFD
jgi:hypothetical protein